MSVTFRLAPDRTPADPSGPTFRAEKPREPEVMLTADESAYLAGLSEEAEWSSEEEFESQDDGERDAARADEEWELEEEWEDLTEPAFLYDAGAGLGAEEALAGEWFGEVEANDDDAERVIAGLARRRSLGEDELQAPRRSRWTPCFTAAEAAQTIRLYEENDDAAASDPPGQPIDRASCIVMLNVGLGRLLNLRTVDRPARGRTGAMPRQPRTVRMGALTVGTVNGALNQLVRSGLATSLPDIDFLNHRGRRAGTLPPVSLRSSVSDAVTSRAPNSGCWYAFGLSLVDATHSVLLLVDFTGSARRIYWLDQYTRGLTKEVTTTLDAEITAYTQRLWQHKLATKGIRFSTIVRLWRLRKPAP